MDRQSVIRAELIRTEKVCNAYHHLIGKGYKAQEIHQHFMSRRRFFLRDLLKVQLKEFKK